MHQLHADDSKCVQHGTDKNDYYEYRAEELDHKCESLFPSERMSVLLNFLGKLLHAYIIGEIKVDMIFFPTRITSTGYIMSYLLTLVFASVVMLALYGKIKRISMTESLKTVE